MKESILSHRAYAHLHGMDAPEVSQWQWSGATAAMAPVAADRQEVA